MSDLEGKVALVTGASRGIGAAIARRLAADGARVVIHYVQRVAAAEQAASDIAAAGGQAAVAQADLSEPDAPRRLVGDALRRFGGLDILVNNAALYEPRALEAVDMEHVRRVFSLNFVGVLLSCREAALHLREEGRIVNVSSGLAQIPAPGFCVYGASKAALESLTRSLAAELGPRGITVNAVSPGITDTDMLREGMPVETQQALIRNTPLGRLGRPEDIADVVAFLASPGARWITGQVIGVNGGLR